MKHSTGKPTPEEFAWLEAVKSSGCLACRINAERGDYAVVPGWPYCEADHVLSGSKRIGHMASRGLCSFHHRGVCLEGVSRAKMEAGYGPSFAESKKRFRQHYGSDVDMLDMQREVLAGYSP